MHQANRHAYRRMSISVVLPAYNEAANIERTVLKVHEALSSLVDDFEIIVTNDGSRDGTGRVLADLQERRPELRVRVVTHTVNQGYGAALASGFDAARKDYIFFTDSDQQFDVRELPLLLAEMDEATDLVIGWRRQRADPALRRLNAWGWKQVITALFGYTARDIDCAFKLVRRQVWQSYTVYARGAIFSAEFLVKARRLGFVVTEVGVSHFPRLAGSATGAWPSVVVRAFIDLFRLWRNLDDELAHDPRAQTADVRPRPAS